MFLRFLTVFDGVFKVVDGVLTLLTVCLRVLTVFDGVWRCLRVLTVFDGVFKGVDGV